LSGARSGSSEAAGRRPDSGGGEPGRGRHAHLFADLANGDVEQLIEPHLGLVADQATNLAEIGDPAPHVLERAAVDLLVGNELDLRAAVAQALDALGEVEHGDFLVSADVED